MSLVQSLISNQESLFTPITGAVSLTPHQAGGVIALSNAGSAYTINLPLVSSSAGLEFNFLLGSAPNAAITIAAGAACVYGVIQDITAGFQTALASHTNIIVGTTAVRGTQIYLKCDGTTYFARCISLVSGSITDS